MALWKSSQGIEHHIAMMNRSSCASNAVSSVNAPSHRPGNSKYEKRTSGGIAESQVNYFYTLFLSTNRRISWCE